MSNLETMGFRQIHWRPPAQPRAIGQKQFERVPERSAPLTLRTSPMEAISSFHIFTVSSGCFVSSARPTTTDTHARQSAAAEGMHPHTRLRCAERPDLKVVAIAAGERWKDGSLRPAVEDLWGAGGFLSALQLDRLSPEARAAKAAYDAVANELPVVLHDCAGGRELTQYGFPEDVAIAAEVDSSRSVPVLRDGKMSTST